MINQPIDDQDRGMWTSASNAEADSLCPGRYRAQLAFPEGEVSEDALVGKEVHAWLHWKRIGESGPEPKVSDIELAWRCWDLEKKEVVEWRRLLPESVKEYPLLVMSERRMWHEVPGGLRHSGQPDGIYSIATFALLIDTKSGFNEVPPPNTNQQLRDLAALHWSNFSSTEVWTQIVSARAERQPPCRYDLPALKRAAYEMEIRVAACHSPEARRTPNAASCKFCRAKGTDRCPESILAVASIPAMAIESIPTPRFLEACLLARPIIESALERAYLALEKNPDAIPGFMLSPNPSTFAINNPQEVWRRCENRGMTMEDFLKCVRVSKGDLEDMLKDVIRSQSGQSRIKGWKATWDALLEGITTEQPKRSSVVRVKS